MMLRFQFLIKIDQNENYLCYALLFGSDKLSDFEKVWILSATIEYFLSTERFNFVF